MEPPLIWRSVEDLLAAASAQERHDARCYREIAQRALARGETATAETAGSLAAEAERRAAAILVHAGDISPIPKQGRPGAPALGGGMAERWEDLLTSGSLTPYRLLAHAVACTAAAFADYAYAASGAEGEVRAVAERLAREELDRAAQLRAERRRAFHEAGRARPFEALEPDQLDREVRLRLGDLDRLLRGLAERCRAQGDTASADLLGSLAPGARAGEDVPSARATTAGTPEDALRRALYALQARAETLENLAARTPEETVLADSLAALEQVVTAIGRVTARLEEVRQTSDPIPARSSRAS